MMKDIFAFNFLGMRTAFTPSALLGSVFLIVVVTIAALFLTELTLPTAILGAVIATLIHWVGEVIHMYGHFVAAKQTGYPSTGVKLWAVIGIIRYPRDEPELAPNIHIRRALGGPIINAIVLVICIILAVLFWSNPGLPRFLLGFAVFSNILFSVGALFPPIYIESQNLATDGGTIMYWMRKK